LSQRFTPHEPALVSFPWSVNLSSNLKVFLDKKSANPSVADSYEELLGLKCHTAASTHYRKGGQEDTGFDRSRSI
jgi:hypothetical protein